MMTSEASVPRKAYFVLVSDGKEVPATGLGDYPELRTVSWQIICNSATENTDIRRAASSAEHASNGIRQRPASYLQPFYQEQPPRDIGLPSERTLLFGWKEPSPDIRGGSVGTAFPLSDPRRNLHEEIEEFFRSLDERNIEEAGEDDFLRALTFFVKRDGEEAIAAIARLVLSSGMPEEIASETLRQLGSLDHAPTHQSRLELFEQGLSSDSEQVRYTAALGLASLDDPEAIPYLQQALELEKYADLRKVFIRVLEQLENAR